MKQSTITALACGLAATILLETPLGAQTYGRLVLASFGVTAGNWKAKNLRFAADVNNDQKADIVGIGEDAVFVSLANKTGGFDQPVQAIKDFLPRGGWDPDVTPRVMADVNGDGRADIIGFALDGVYVSLATGTGQTFQGFAPKEKWLDSMGKNQGWGSNSTTPRVAADVNHDGRADLIGFAIDGVYVALAKNPGTGFENIVKYYEQFGFNQGWANLDVNPRTAADVNGDGWADIIGFASDGVYVALNDQKGHFSKLAKWTTYFSASNGGWSSQETAPRVIADVNGDKKADIIGFADGGVYVATSDSVNSKFTDAKNWSPGWGINSSWPSQADGPRTVADYDGDGLGDIIGFANDGVRVGVNVKAAAFLPPGVWNLPSSRSYDYHARVMAEINRIRLLGTTGKKFLGWLPPKYNTKGQVDPQCSSGPVGLVVWNDPLSEAAYSHSSYEIISGNLVNNLLTGKSKDPHSGPDGTTFTQRIEAKGGASGGEAVNFATMEIAPEELAQLWITMSPTHCGVVMNGNMKVAGFSAVGDPGLAFYTLDFAASSTQW